MSVDLKQIDLSTMTWREIFSVIEDNFNTVISAILARSTECTMEQFSGGSYTYTISQVIDDDTTLLVFKGNQYIGGRTGTGYTYASQVLTFTEAVDSDDMISVMMLHSEIIS